ncbi:MAG: hypothetical protein ABI771_10910 [Betaproteobacteria bacterium]
MIRNDSALTLRTGLVATLILCAPVALADCAEQLQRLSTDLRGVALTETQKQTIGGMVDEARRYCWVHREEIAMVYVTKARNIAGIKPAVSDNDWETVPLESLERTPPPASTDPDNIKR